VAGGGGVRARTYAEHIFPAPLCHTSFVGNANSTPRGDLIFEYKGLAYGKKMPEKGYHPGNSRVQDPWGVHRVAILRTKQNSVGTFYLE